MNMYYRKKIITSLLALSASVIFLPGVLFGHASGENYVWLNIETNGISGRFELNIDDLDKRLGVDLLEHGATIDEGVVAAAPQVQEFIREHFEVVIRGEALPLEFLDVKIFEEGRKFAQYYYRIAMEDVPSKITLRNSIFLSKDDPLHRSLLVLAYNERKGEEYGLENAIMAFGPNNQEQELDLDNLPALLNPGDFLWQGTLHIWIGLDHILFLLVLLLMTVMVRGEKGEYQPVVSFKKAFWNVLKVVTVFTIAHSITLSLAALNIIQVSSRFVESAIALSIVVVAINNVFPRFNDKAWLVIFLFGLFHGMGFATVMGVLPFRTIALLKPLIGFNVGVELGQLAIVMVIFPLLFLFRKTAWYRPVVLVGGSVVIGLIAVYWFVERAFGL